MPESVRNLLAVNSMGCIKLPHRRGDLGLFIEIYRLSSARRNGRVAALGTFRVSNVPETELVEQIQRLIDWLEGL